MFHYYVKLVPTLYVKADGTKTYSNQYAVTQTAKNVMVKQGELTGLPGVFFVYEFNPFLIQKEEREVAFTSFLTSVSAIIGGTFTISRLVDTVIFSSMCAMMGAPPRTV